MNAEDFHCFRSDPLVRWRGIADVLEAQPEAWEWALAAAGPPAPGTPAGMAAAAPGRQERAHPP